MLIQAGVSTAAINSANGFNTLATSQTTATVTTGSLSASFKGLWATMKPILVGIATNPFTWAIAGG